jgi:ADP-heptose:LPS heptosyltransferase
VETYRIMTVGGIGDVLLLTPALRALKQAHPSCVVKVYAISPAHYDVLRHNPHINSLKLVRRGRTLQWLRSSPIDFACLWLNRLPGARFRLRPIENSGYARLCPSLLANRHATEIIGEKLGVKVTDRRLEVYLTATEENKARDIVQRYRNPVALHITSSCSENQNWPLDKWNDLVKRNPQYDFIQLGLSDEKRVEGALDLRSKLGIRESVAVLKHVRGFVGVVSSLAHASNAVGTPSVVLFGASTPSVWGHANHEIVTKRLRCSPCIDMLAGVKCPYGAPCMSDISVEEVEAAIEKQFGSGSGKVSAAYLSLRA